MKDLLKTWAVVVLDRLADLRGPAWQQSASQIPLAEELRRTITEMDSRPGSSAGQCGPEWAGNLSELRRLIESDDPANFLRWPVIKRTMFVSNCLTAVREWRWLKHSEHRDRWLHSLEETSVGNPCPFLLARKTSCNQLHHTYHLAQFEDRTRCRIAEAQLVFEFGGGFGDMCRQVHKFGFRGRYVIFDLPECAALQRYFLKSIGLPIVSHEEWSQREDGIILVSDLMELKQLMPPAAARSSPRLFIATWSLSETPAELREQIHALARAFDWFLLAYQTSFGSVDNIEFFARWALADPRVVWHGYAVPAIKASNYYLIGAR